VSDGNKMTLVSFVNDIGQWPKHNPYQRTWFNRWSLRGMRCWKIFIRGFERV